jgi:DNA-directed RNA polymerase specialized sigma24 family protein
VDARFPTTRWTIVSAAGYHSLNSAEALNELCAAYWFSVYAFIRRKGYSPDAAEDLCQGFFARILEHDTLSGASRERGKFRSFLLASLTNFLSNEWDRSQAQKRGGRITTLSLDFEAGEARYHREPCHELTPDALFERRWAVAVLDRVLARLRGSRHKPRRFPSPERLSSSPHFAYGRITDSVDHHYEI